jgi:uncharacterized repeat protein (TIGR03803 family)
VQYSIACLDSGELIGTRGRVSYYLYRDAKAAIATLGCALSTLYSFCSQTKCADGEVPATGLVQATKWRPLRDDATLGSQRRWRDGLQNYPGRRARQNSFCSLSNCTDGGNPIWSLVQAVNGNLYGRTTEHGGTNAGAGTLFEITTGGALTTLHDFCPEPDCADGEYPNSVMQATNGDLYGTASGGATDTGCIPNLDGAVAACGATFGLSAGLSPFVEALPVAGLVGEPVRFLGTNLTGASSVSFIGTAASFVVVSSAEIVATVPSGATCGTVQVVARSGTLQAGAKVAEVGCGHSDRVFVRKTRPRM